MRLRMATPAGRQALANDPSNDCVEFCLYLLLCFRVEYHIQNYTFHSGCCRIRTSCRVNHVNSGSHLALSYEKHASHKVRQQVCLIPFSFLVCWIGFIQLCNVIADKAPSSGPCCLHKIEHNSAEARSIFTTRFSTSRKWFVE